MKTHHLFYLVGVLFIFGSVWYFARQFLEVLPDSIKLTALIFVIIITFAVAEMLRSKEL